MFFQFFLSNGKSIGIDIYQIIAFSQLSTNTTKVFVSNGLSYTITTSYTVLEDLLNENGIYTFTELNDLFGKKLFFRLDLVSAAQQLSTTTTTFFLANLSFSVDISPTNFGILLNTIVNPLLAISTANNLSDYINDDAPQTQTLLFYLDRQVNGLGEINMQVSETTPLPAGFTINRTAIDPDEQAANLAISYAGTGAAVDSYSVTIEFVALEAVLASATITLNVAATTLLKKGKTEKEV